MSDRNLPEPDRGLDQRLRADDRRLRSIERVVSKAGKSRVDTCESTLFNAGVHTPPAVTDAFWVYHPMIEVDVDVGRWLARGLMRFQLHYTGHADELGYETMTLSIFQRLPGSDPSTKTEVISFSKTPLQAPVAYGVDQLAEFRATLPCARTVSSDTGLTLTLEALMKVEGSTSSISPGTDLWLGPGVLIATPL